MDRHTLVIQDCIRELRAMRVRIGTVLNRPEKYLDPDYALEPTTGSTFWEQYEKVSSRITGEFPELATSIAVRKPPAGWDQPLDREELISFDRDIGALVKFLTKDVLS